TAAPCSLSLHDALPISVALAQQAVPQLMQQRPERGAARHRQRGGADHLILGRGQARLLLRREQLLAELLAGAQADEDNRNILVRSEEHTSELQSPCNLV